jgi:hypothetical protein
MCTGLRGRRRSRSWRRASSRSGCSSISDINVSFMWT